MNLSEIDIDHIFSIVPSVPMKVIINHLSISDIIGFSLSSKESATAIRLSRMPPIHMYILITSECIRIRVHKTSSPDKRAEWVFLKNSRRKNMLRWVVNDMILMSWSTKTKGSEKRYYTLCRKNMAITINTVISHFFYICHQCVVAGLYVNYEGLDQNFKLETALNLVDEVKHVYLTGQHFNESSKFILEHIRITESVVGCFTTTLYKDVVDRLGCTELIFFKNASWMTRQSLLRINSSIVRLLKTRFTQSDIMAFLLKWRDSTGELDNVRYMDIYHPSGREKLDLAVLNAEPWDSVMSPRSLNLKNDYAATLRYELTSGFDIRRIDGRLATVFPHTYINRVIFIVWDE